MNIHHTNANHDCRCAARMEAQREGRFFYATAHSGYAWRDAEGVPRRKDNRPFTWVTCPFCGYDLPVGDEV